MRLLVIAGGVLLSALSGQSPLPQAPAAAFNGAITNRPTEAPAGARYLGTKACAACHAAQAARQTPPEGGRPRDFRVPAGRTAQLDNGMGLNFVQYGSVPKATVLLIILLTTGVALLARALGLRIGEQAH